MVDIKKESKEQATPAQATAEQLHMPSKQSKGEKLFTWGVYNGLNYWLNLASSIAIADYFCNRGGQQAIESGATKLAGLFSKPGTTGFAKTFGQTKTALRTLTLLSGGWALVIPIKILEDNKRPIVHWLNEKLGVDQTGADGHKLTSDEIYIEQEQPPQSWLNVIMRRAMATAAVMGTGQVLNAALRDRPKTDAYKAAHPESTSDPHGGKQVVEDFVVRNVNKGLNAIGATALTKNPHGTFQRYLGLAALDTVFTKITAVIMHMTNGAKRARLPTEISDDSDPIGIPKTNRIETDLSKPAEHLTRESGSYASRIMAEKGAQPSRIKPSEKAKSFTALAEKTESSPTLAV